MEYQKRKSHRFEADPGTIASISFKLDSFEVDTKGLVFNESFMGCACVFLKNENLIEGSKCIIKCGEIDPIGATIRWITRLDSDVLKAGFEYDEE